MRATIANYKRENGTTLEVFDDGTGRFLYSDPHGPQDVDAPTLVRVLAIIDTEERDEWTATAGPAFSSDDAAACWCGGPHFYSEDCP